MIFIDQGEEGGWQDGVSLPEGAFCLRGFWPEAQRGIFAGRDFWPEKGFGSEASL